MADRNLITKILALLGTLLVWVPIFAPLIFSIGFLATSHGFRFDYLMLAELFPVVLAGGLALLWAAFRARMRRKIIGWGLGIAVGMLVGGQLLAVLTGLASGEAEPTGWPWALVVASLAAFSLSVVALGAGGILLLTDLFRPRNSPGHLPGRGAA